MNIKKVLLTLLIVVYVASFISVFAVNAEDGIGDYDNVSAEQVIKDINSTINSSINEGEIKYDQNYTLYRLTVVPTSVTVGQEVTAIAETNNPRVTHVTFVWVKPFDGIKKIETVQVYSEGNLKKANSKFNPDMPGLWWVFALFEQRNTGSCRCGWLFAMRWVCCACFKVKQVIPDFPVVGTAGAITTMFAGLGLFLNKKRQKPA
ncbi:MAG: hypothetical protein QW791_05710 [Candidatus Bathyarchaeia archaeon]